MSLLFFMIGLCGLLGFGSEAKLLVEFEDVTITLLDPKYFDPTKTYAVIKEDEDTGESTMNCSVSVIEELPVEAEIHVGLIGLSMGKYTVPTGLDLRMDLCSAMGEPIIIGPLLGALGFSEDVCPPKLGIYSHAGYQLSLDNLPDEFPENRYLGVLEMSIHGKNIVVSNIHLSVQNE